MLKAGFAPLFAVFAPLAGDHDPEAVTEAGWAAIHGLAVLARDGRLRPEHQAERLEVVLEKFTNS
nr:hypothetical protein GCM10025732_42670 [Glycomyces mayteni]